MNHDLAEDGPSRPPGRLVIAVAAPDRFAHVEVRVFKQGSTLAGLTDALSTAITIGLHAGAPVSKLVTEMRYTHYAPAGDAEVTEGHVPR